jgi:glycosyltransferase involved in cell wall biosynthesis
MVDRMAGGPSEFLFVIEDGLGHAVHAANVERVLAGTAHVAGRVIRVRPPADPRHAAPFVENWSVQTSWLTRRAVEAHTHHDPIDALFIHTQVASLLARPIMRRVPTIVSLDATPRNFDTMADAYQHLRQTRAVEWGKDMVSRRALHASAAIVTWSQWAADSVVGDYGVAPERVHVIPPGVDVDAFRPRAWHDESRRLRVLFVGGDFVRKGGPYLLRAAAALGDDVELDIVTREPVGPCGANVRVHTDVAPNSATMAALLSDADVFALPSLGDCTPLAIAEALASGLPIVASTVGALSELVTDGWNGFLVPPGDAPAIAASLSKLSGDTTLRSVMGRRSRQLAESQHDMTKNWRRVFDLMSHVADDAVGPRSSMASAPSRPATARRVPLGAGRA